MIPCKWRKFQRNYRSDQWQRVFKLFTIKIKIKLKSKIKIKIFERDILAIKNGNLTDIHKKGRQVHPPTSPLPFLTKLAFMVTICRLISFNSFTSCMKKMFIHVNGLALVSRTCGGCGGFWEPMDHFKQRILQCLFNTF